MLQWQFWNFGQGTINQYNDTVDLGNGFVARTEDMLDGHALRLRKAQIENRHDTMNRDLTTAMHQVAPQLAPLTDLAHKIADTSLDVQPKHKFRQDLQQALESSHRQQNVRRSLGMQPPARKDPPFWRSFWFIALLAMFAMTLFALARKHKRGQ